MTWKTIWSETAQKQLERLPKKDIKRILLKIKDDVEKDPYQHVARLVGQPFYRLRVGHYRIIMQILNGKMLILILQVKKRSKAYKK